MSPSENNDSTWPQDLFDFCYISALDERLQELSQLVEVEDWEYHSAETDHRLPVLFNYLRYTYRRLAEERKIGLSADG